MGCLVLQEQYHTDSTSLDPQEQHKVGLWVEGEFTPLAESQGAGSDFLQAEGRTRHFPSPPK